MLLALLLLLLIEHWTDNFLILFRVQVDSIFIHVLELNYILYKTFIADSRSILKQFINIIHYNALNKIYTKGIKYKFS